MWRGVQEATHDCRLTTLCLRFVLCSRAAADGGAERASRLSRGAAAHCDPRARRPRGHHVRSAHPLCSIFNIQYFRIFYFSSALHRSV